jgi:hypothetical protein
MFCYTLGPIFRAVGTTNSAFFRAVKNIFSQIHIFSQYGHLSDQNQDFFTQDNDDIDPESGHIQLAIHINDF